MSGVLESTVEEEVGSVRMGRPHVFVLGAGASRANCPNGDAAGLTLPLMNDLVDALDLRGKLKSWGIDPDQNFEEVFSSLHEQGRVEKVDELQKIIESYFGRLKLPSTPTIYDHLLLSLRGKDIVATFNWDPLLIQAYKRNIPAGLTLPRMIFLHGNVASGYCEQDKVTGDAHQSCPHCGQPFQRAPLLYPIRKKDYAANQFIAREWAALQHGLKDAFMITIFGYSGPKSDTEAIATMSAAWGNPQTRAMEQMSFITIQNNHEVTANWDGFIHSHHYEIDADFYQSWTANHPRRTGEAYMNQYLDAEFIENNPIPKDADFPSLWRWFGKFRQPEDDAT